MPDGVEGGSDGREVVDVVDQKGRTRLYASLARFVQSIFCPYQATLSVLPPDHAVGSAIIRPACNLGFVAPSLVPFRPSKPGVRCILPSNLPSSPSLLPDPSTGRPSARHAARTLKRTRHTWPVVARSLAIIRVGRRRALFVPAQSTARTPARPPASSASPVANQPDPEPPPERGLVPRQM